MEAHVYVQKGGLGNPWLRAVCPKCKCTVYESQKFCPHCGVPLSFNDYETVFNNGYSAIKNKTAEWTRYIPRKTDNIEHFFNELMKLERTHQIEETSIIKIMREAYCKTCADELFKLDDFSNK